MKHKRQFFINSWKNSMIYLCWVLPLFVVLLWTQEQVTTVNANIPLPDGRTQVIAHRAGAAAAPENTLAALKNAIATGASWAEIDVRITKDGVLIAMHDSSLERTTGLKQLVSQTDALTIQKLDAGAWYASAYRGEPVPTLDELLKMAKSRIRLMIELKCDTQDLNLVEQVVTHIRDAGMEGQCALACTNLKLLEYSKQLSPKLETVYIASAVDQAVCQLDYVDSYSIDSAHVTDQLVQRIRAQGKKVFAWTVNTKQHMAQMLERNVDGIITDDPDKALRLMWGNTD